MQGRSPIMVVYYTRTREGRQPFGSRPRFDEASAQGYDTPGVGPCYLPGSRRMRRDGKRLPDGADLPIHPACMNLNDRIAPRVPF